MREPAFQIKNSTKITNVAFLINFMALKEKAAGQTWHDQPSHIFGQT